MLRYLTFRRELLFAGIVAVALGAGCVGYYIGERRGEAKSGQNSIVNLSANDIEVEEPAKVPPMQSSIGVENNPPSTGTRITPDRYTSGNGKILAINGTPFDACVFVLDTHSRQTVRSVYIKANDSFSFDHIEPGNYRIVYTTGTGWNRDSGRFSQNASYFEFGQILSFQERDGTIEKYTITLHAVPNGNVQAQPLSESEFGSLSTGR